MDSQASPYYPPRARWYSSLWRLWYPVKRRLYLDRLPTIGRHEVGRSLLGLVLPGWALLWSPKPRLGVILGLAYYVAVPVFVIWRGYPVSNIALMLMITIHAGSVLRIERSSALWKRCLSSLMVFLVLGGLIYQPLVNQMELRWFVALRVGNHVVKIRTGLKPGEIRRGDWIAYRIFGLGSGHGHEVPLWVIGGCTLGRVMAVAGDEVAFRPDRVWVNGDSLPRSASMPTNGTVQVEQGCWFVWPEMTINNEGNVDSEIIAQTMMRLAKVAETNYVGMAYQRWFWRKQVLP
jgi:hypothetical protein